MKSKYESAVCCLIKSNGKYLAVSRRGDTSKWGFPGGKVDAFESHDQAIQRELFEECGLKTSMNWFEPVFSSVCEGDVSYWVTTYVVQSTFKDRNIIPEEGLTVDWKTEEEMCDPSVSPFAKYNKAVFNSLKEMCHSS